MTNGEVHCWGRPDYNARGVRSATPTAVPELQGAVQMEMGSGHGCAVFANGQVACWGYNLHGELLDNQLTQFSSDRWIPVISPLVPPITSEAGQCFTGFDNSGNGLVDCEDPDCRTSLGSATGRSVAEEGDVADKGNYTFGSCGGEGGAERVYEWVAPAAGRYLAWLTRTSGSANVDLTLYARQGTSCFGVELDCANSPMPMVDLTVGDGERVYLVADSLAVRTGFGFTTSGHRLGILPADELLVAVPANFSETPVGETPVRFFATDVAPFIRVEEPTAPGGFALRTGHDPASSISNSFSRSSFYLETTESGTLEWDWAVSGPSNSRGLILCTTTSTSCSSRGPSINGETDWETGTLPLNAGIHRIILEYNGNSSGDLRGNAGWITNLRFVPD